MDPLRKFAQALLTARKSGGEIFLAQALSPDGKHIAFLSNGSFTPRRVFLYLWVGEAEKGKRIERLVKSTVDPNFEELRVLYSQSAFSPDGKLIAVTGQWSGKDALYVVDVQSPAKRTRLALPLEGVTGPTWSPDGKQIAFS